MKKTRELRGIPAQGKEKDANTPIREPRSSAAGGKTGRDESPSPPRRNARIVDVDLEKGLPQVRFEEIEIKRSHSPASSHLFPEVVAQRGGRARSAGLANQAVQREFGPNLDRIPESEWVSEDAIDHKGFSRRVADAAEGEMFHDLKVDNGQVLGKALNLSIMQRMNLHALQRELVRVASDIHEIEHRPQNFETEPDWYRLKLAMADYCGYYFLI